MNQLMRYGMVGVASNLIIYFLYLLITDYGIEPKTAMTLVYITGVSISFFANKKFTFSDKGGVIGSGTRYVITYLFGYLLNFLILSIFVDNLGHPHQLVQGIAIFAVACFLFTSLKFFVFKDSRSTNRVTS
jgi:putative flippase GtrA